MLHNCSDKKTRNQGGTSLVEKHLPVKSFKRFCECGNWIEFFVNREETKYTVYQANFCKNRFCPMCAWRLAHKDAMKISVLMEYLETEHEKAFIFLTLTAPNVRGEDLNAEIERYNLAFKNLCKRDEVARVVQGYIRKLEITYEKGRKGYYHPHFHVLIAVNKGYFAGHTYLKQAKWLELWRDVMGDESITQLNVKRVRNNGSKNEVSKGKAANEVAAYAAKDEDYFKSQEIFDVFYGALKGRQMLTYSGLFAEANKKYKAGELDKYKTTDDTEYVWLLLARWGGSEYTERKRQEISREEYMQLKSGAIDEMPVV